MEALWRPVKRFRKWETLFIIHPDRVGEKEQVFDKIKEIVESREGKVLKVDEWGMKKLAYPIQKKNHGYYVYMVFYGLSDLPQKLEDYFRIDERVIRFIIVKLKDRYKPGEEEQNSEEQ
ncbi:MAG: 30S ribosomal protein S6 [Thermodesulfobacteria bacterium]|nr:30S ribosomal protein S6 [Thermodesulfobacteriota bacterium]